jgi:hypothetical protein
MLVGLVVGVTLFVMIFRGILETDTSVPVDGESHTVSVPTDGDRMIWAETLGERPQCTVIDRSSGQEVRLEATNGDFERNEQIGVRTFDPGSGDLDITCTGEPGTEIEVGPAPSITGLVGGIVAAVGIPLLVGGSGFLIVVITGILFVSRPPRPRRA